MQSKATSVDIYLTEVPADRLSALTQLRALCLEELRGYKEAMTYGMPCYEKNNIAEAGFASQKNFIALYILKKEVMDKYKELLKGKGVSTGKGCIRFTKPGKINFEIVQKMLRDTFTSPGTICG
ncbi:MAG: DUF1801 domain-containing protein [Chitinophagaceae bacterium]|nr:DUF1801 domain-containing protein [Chitinophagaceae bacterium]